MIPELKKDTGTFLEDLSFQKEVLQKFFNPTKPSYPGFHGTFWKVSEKMNEHNQWREIKRSFIQILKDAGFGEISGLFNNANLPSLGFVACDGNSFRIGLSHQYSDHFSFRCSPLEGTLTLVLLEKTLVDDSLLLDAFIKNLNKPQNFSKRMRALSTFTSIVAEKR